ncbi:biotin-dependent carboxyltransferase family protein [Oceanobacillus piezotolerans]|uniref:Biotin-dependent carboxyltransferase family protein n=1 Tax=Oceanobacillus piezotolerans TaxID=2448030 RepID=A0A498D6P6_9BACI|nr:biotin-dependent carboxyltransferase family protein [Oceanobacillus piezotolerans]RLL42824.1 biotin-dependent carboxyltransferase family protein [Oceanobacillus piezotolerans]
MNNSAIEVLRPGLSTSIQDLGRTGYQQFGMVVAGAMDTFALQIGNILVGNERGAAGIEVVLMGPKLKFLRDTVIAICGANLSPMIDGRSISMWRSQRVYEGQILSFGKPVDGSYAYIALSGGITTPLVMGSRSTYTKAQTGGLDGRFLNKGDVLPSGEPNFDKYGKQLHPEWIPDYNKTGKIRVILGPDEEAFTKEGIHNFLTKTYKVTTQTDRMGSRLEGPAIEHVDGADIISDAIFPGTVQVPANGNPIILLADRQPTGGYTRIATVISEDIPLVAQSLPGKEIAFEAVTLNLANKLYQRRENFLKTLSKIV